MIAAEHQGDGRTSGAAGAARQAAALDTLLVVLLFSAMNFGRYFSVGGSALKVLPIDVLVGASLVYALTARRFRVRMGGELFLLLALIALNVAYEIFSVIAIDGGATENISLAVALLRNAVLVFTVAQLDFDFDKTRRWLMSSGVVFSLIGIAGWLKAVRNYSQIVAARALHDPQIFYVYSDGQLRLQGLREDPNFFFIINLIPLVMGISLIRERRGLWPLLGTGVILTASVLTFSRSGALLLALLVLFLLAGDLARLNVRRLFLTAAAIVALVAAARLLSDAYGLPDVGEIMATRFERAGETGGSGRARLWAGAWEGFKGAVIFGQGGRYTSRTFGQYAHNDYLEMLSSHGLVGFALMTGMWLYVVSFIASRYLQARLVPLFAYGALCFLIMLGASLFFTIYYNPYIWFTVALIFSVKEGACAEPG